MLYKYRFIQNHKMRKLHQHLLYFLRKIKNVDPNASYSPKLYFHSSFLNKKGEIAPSGKINKKLNNSFELFFNTYKKLSNELKEEFYDIAFKANGFISFFWNKEVEVEIFHSINIKRILGNDSFKDLMSNLWDNLSTNAWEIDKHYQLFFENLPESKICPFCGINQLPNPSSYRADYDHIADKSSYPLFAINLKNIAPSCGECNQKYKFGTDVFYTKKEGIKSRRVFIYPYSYSREIIVEFDGTILPETDIEKYDGVWNLNFKPDEECIISWLDIYDIKRRYIDEVLAVDYKVWIGNFIKELKEYNIIINNYEELQFYFKNHYLRYSTNILQKRYILKSAIFKYLSECNNIIFYDLIIKQIN